MTLSKYNADHENRYQSHIDALKEKLRARTSPQPPLHIETQYNNSCQQLQGPINQATFLTRREMSNHQTDNDPAQLSAGRKPTYIKEQHNNNCQQFFGPISNCQFIMPAPAAQEARQPKKPSRSAPPSRRPPRQRPPRQRP